MYRKLIHTDNSQTTIIIRMIVGAVFLSEGIQKFLFPAIRGAGRFEKIGLPSKNFWEVLLAVLKLFADFLFLLVF